MLNFIKVWLVKFVEKSYGKLFWKEFKFDKNIIKKEDLNLPDKYDNNAFVCSGQITKDQLEKMIFYQKNKGLNFVKIESKIPLTLEDFEDETNYVMLYTKKKEKKLPKDVSIKKASFEEVLNLELKHYAEHQGEDFTNRNIKNLYSKLNFFGIYFQNEIKGFCYKFTYNGFSNIDDLLINKEDRNKGYGSLLLKSLSNKKTFIHAYANDEPLKLYLKLGFKIIKTNYEYLKILKD